MYGIFTNIYHQNTPNVGKYTIHLAKLYQIIIVHLVFLEIFGDFPSKMLAYMDDMGIQTVSIRRPSEAGKSLVQHRKFRRDFEKKKRPNRPKNKKATKDSCFFAVFKP